MKKSLCLVKTLVVSSVVKSVIMSTPALFLFVRSVISIFTRSAKLFIVLVLAQIEQGRVYDMMENGPRVRSQKDRNNEII